MDFTMASKVGELLKDGKAVEIIEKYVPGLSKNPLVKLARGMSLEDLLKMPQAKQAGLTPEMLTNVLNEINAARK